MAAIEDAVDPGAGTEAGTGVREEVGGGVDGGESESAMKWVTSAITWPEARRAVCAAPPSILKWYRHVSMLVLVVQQPWQ
jgi:hypothetical protein